jgi:hypothetical protein
MPPPSPGEDPAAAAGATSLPLAWQDVDLWRRCGGNTSVNADVVDDDDYNNNDGNGNGNGNGDGNDGNGGRDLVLTATAAAPAHAAAAAAALSLPLPLPPLLLPPSRLRPVLEGRRGGQSRQSCPSPCRERIAA